MRAIFGKSEDRVGGSIPHHFADRLEATLTSILDVAAQDFDRLVLAHLLNLPLGHVAPGGRGDESAPQTMARDNVGIQAG